MLGCVKACRTPARALGPIQVQSPVRASAGPASASIAAVVAKSLNLFMNIDLQGRKSARGGIFQVSKSMKNGIIRG